MKRATILLAALGSLLVVPALFAQSQATSALPPEILGPQLIAWSQLQKPHPMPQPLPPPDQPAQPSDRQSAQQPGTQPSDSDVRPQEPTAQTFTGTIVKDGSKYVLKVADNSTYQLDDQEKMKEFEGKQVKISGTLDANLKILHVTRIELIS
jgi:uncharacterized protein DUF5818